MVNSSSEPKSTLYFREDMHGFKLWENYSRLKIAEMLGVEKEAIWRGVFTPRGRKLIVLFVTREKQSSQTQYNDSVFGDTLVWEGEKKHGNDQRIINAANKGDKIILFFRARHHRPFIYFGPIRLKSYVLRDSQPSCFVFKIDACQPEVAEESASTERIATRSERVGQGAFRENVLRLWSDSCAVTSLPNKKVLRASHIRPWRHCDDEARLDRYNGLVLTPNLDLLFDLGFVTFSIGDGSIRLSNALDNRDWRILNVQPGMSLRVVFPESEKYIEYHNDCVYESWNKADATVLDP